MLFLALHADGVEFADCFASVGRVERDDLGLAGFPLSHAQLAGVVRDPMDFAVNSTTWEKVETNHDTPPAESNLRCREET